MVRIAKHEIPPLALERSLFFDQVRPSLSVKVDQVSSVSPHTINFVNQAIYSAPGMKNNWARMVPNKREVIIIKEAPLSVA